MRRDFQLEFDSIERDARRVEDELERIGRGPTRRGTTLVPGQVAVLDRDGALAAIVGVWLSSAGYGHTWVQALAPTGLAWSIAGYLGIPRVREYAPDHYAEVTGSPYRAPSWPETRARTADELTREAGARVRC